MSRGVTAARRAGRVAWAGRPLVGGTVRIERITATGVSPIERFEADGLADVVVIAGANGAGKSRLIGALLSYLQGTLREGMVALRIGATCNEEEADWGKALLDTTAAGDTQLLARTLRRQRPRSKLRSSILNFESDRTVQAVRPLPFTWDLPDVTTELVEWQTVFQPLMARYQDTVHSLFKMVRKRSEAVARNVIPHLGDPNQAPADLLARLAANHPDPVAPFAEAFARLLAPKTLAEPDPRQQGLFYLEGGARYPFASLSSGEREVVNIVFDFLLRAPEDCVVFFDEPELHLHPELSTRLLWTLSGLGARNQFVFATHSPEIISASLEHSVFFVARGGGDGRNQAVPVREGEDANEALKHIGQSIGVVALGKRIVLIEGAKSSIDTQTYTAVVKDLFPNLVLVPSGDKHKIASFGVVERDILRRTLWGVSFFMLCDGDSRPGTTDADGRLRRLQRCHIENYFLDEAVIAQVFSDLESPDSPLRSARHVRGCLREIARTLVPLAVALAVSAQTRDRFGNLDVMPSGLDQDGATVSGLLAGKAQEELARAQQALQGPEIEAAAQELERALLQSLNADTDEWKRLIPGKQLISIFASRTRLGLSRFKTAYLRKSEGLSPSPFAEVIEIFRSFSEL